MGKATKWGDYIITCVTMSDNGEHIKSVGGYPIIMKDGAATIGSYKSWTRRQVVELLDSGKVFTTATKNAEGGWDRGAEVHPVRVTTTFIRTEKDATDKDNLGSLPKC